MCKSCAEESAQLFDCFFIFRFFLLFFHENQRCTPFLLFLQPFLSY